MSYDYAANGWQQHESGLWFKKMDGVWFYVTPEHKFLFCVNPVMTPSWAEDSVTLNHTEQLDAAWAAELKRRKSIPVLDPSKWEGGDDRGCWYHPAEGGYRLVIDIGGLWTACTCPTDVFYAARNVDHVKKCCENHARTRKGLPPL